jgi:hypothetical protein
MHHEAVPSHTQLQAMVSIWRDALRDERHEVPVAELSEEASKLVRQIAPRANLDNPPSRRVHHAP